MKRRKKLLTGFIICMALAGGISISQRVQAANDDFIIQDEVSSQDSVSDSAIQGEVMKNKVMPLNDIDIPKIQSKAVNDENDFLYSHYGYGSGESRLGLSKYNGSDTDVVIPDGCQGILYGAFEGCTDLKSVTLPDSMVEIGQGAFIGCTQLQEINVGAGHPTFSSNNGILYSKDKSILIFYPMGKSDSFTIPSNVVKIDDGAFYGCSSLTNVTIPNSVTNIGNGAFYGCGSLTNVTIPNSATNIGMSAFSNCTNLKSVDIPGRVKRIDSGAFWGCSSLINVTILNSAINMSWGVFDGTPWLENKKQENLNQPIIINNILFRGQMENGNFVIPNGVTSICADAFGDCDWTEREKVTSIIIPTNVESVGECVFAGCENLQELAILNPKTKLGYSYNNSDILDYGDGWTQFKNPTVTIKGYKNSTAQELVDFLNKNWFGDFIGENEWRTVTFKFVPLDGIGDNTPKPSITPKPTKPKTPNKGTTLKSKNTTYKVTKKGSEVAFTKISSAAASVSIPNTVKIGGINYKVTSISPNAFKGNKKLSKVTIGANITSIGKNAFNGCKNLKSIIIKTTKLKSVGQNAFKGIKSIARIKVPSKQLKAYKKLLKGKGQGKKVKITR